jgi:carboxylesterase
MTHHPDGVLIVHGLTATPAVMVPTIEAMEEAGYIVSAPLLPGHGTTEHDLEQTSWQQWASAVHSAYNDLAARCNDIYYIGLSLGALLGLHLAAQSPEKLRALALMSTPLHLSPFVRRIVPVVRYSPIRWIYTTSPKDWKTSVADPDGLEVYKESSYSRIPTKAVYQIYDLEHVVTQELGRIHIPTLLIHSHQDEVAPPSNVAELCTAIANPAPDVLWLEKSYHVVTLDYERDEMNQAILNFFERT